MSVSVCEREREREKEREVAEGGRSEEGAYPLRSLQGAGPGGGPLRGSRRLCPPTRLAPPAEVDTHRGTSLLRERISLGPYRRPMPRVLGDSWGGGRVLRLFSLLSASWEICITSSGFRVIVENPVLGY